MILGITGGLASGKTEAARVLSARGVRVVDADAIARYLTDNDPTVIALIRSQFGQGCFYTEGALNRSALSDMVFSSATHRHALESILHPPISAVLMSNIRAASLSGQHLALEIPLLFESGWDRVIENVLTVSCSEDIQVARAVSRGLSPEQARERIASQMPLQMKESRSRFVIDNSATLIDLQQAVNAIWEGCIAA